MPIANPAQKPAVVEEGDRARPRIGYHHQRQPGQGKDDPFVFHPLFAEYHGDADAGDKEREQQGEPPEQGNQPDLPGNGLAPGQPFPQVGDCAASVSGDGPGPQVFGNVFTPPVFGRGLVVRRGEDGDEAASDVFRWKRAADESHTQYQTQFPGVQGPERAEVLQDSIDEEEKKEREPERHGQVAQGHPGSPKAVGGVCREEADDNGKRKADEDGASADDICHGVGSGRLREVSRIRCLGGSHAESTSGCCVRG